jgi:hypothetical protein
VADAFGAHGMTGRTGPEPEVGAATEDQKGKARETMTNHQMRGVYDAVTSHRMKGVRAAMPISAYRWFRPAGAPSVIDVRVVTALALIVLTGCSPSAAQPFTPVDLPDATTTDAPDSASQSPPSTSTSTVETVAVASGVRVVVERPTVTDAVTNAAIDVVRDYYAARYKAVVSGGKDASYLAVVEKYAMPDAASWVREFRNQQRSLRGTARLYSLKLVSTGDPVRPRLDACVDESGMRLLDSRTGQAVRSQPDWTKKPYLEASWVRRGDDGIWRIQMFRHAKLPSERAKGCLR